MKFGLGATDELCMFVGYYYPSQGPTICLHESGAYVCCPGGGSACN